MRLRLSIIFTFFLLASISLPNFAAASGGYDFPVGSPDGATYGVKNAGGLGFQDRYDYQGDGVLEFHPGEDWNKIGCSSCDFGGPVSAIADGRVIYARYQSTSWGNLVLIEHEIAGKKYWSQYAHMRGLSDRAKEGKSVGRGEVIGYIGDFPSGSGRSVHLHFEIRQKFQSADSFVFNWSRDKVMEYYLEPTAFINSYRPVKASSLTATVSEGRVNLSWTKADDSRFEKYEIYRSSVPGGTSSVGSRELVATVTDASSLAQVDDKIPIGISYYRLVTYFKGGLTSESAEVAVELKREVANVADGSAAQSNPTIINGKIYFEDFTPNGNSANKKLYSYDLKTGEKNSTDIPFGMTYVYAPQGAGNKVAYYSYDRSGCYRVFYYNSETGSHLPVSIGDGVCSQVNPDVSEDGVVVWQQLGPDKTYDIYFNDTNGSTGPQKITTAAGKQINPRIFGSIVVWKDSRNGGFDIYAKNLPDGAEEKLASGTGDGVADVWGRWVTWEYKGKLTLLNLETKLQKVISATGGGYNPTVNDGKVAYTLLEGTTGYVHVYDIASGADTKIDVPLHASSFPSYGDGYVAWDDTLTWPSTNKDIFLTKL